MSIFKSCLMGLSIGGSIGTFISVDLMGASVEFGILYLLLLNLPILIYLSIEK